MPEFACELVFPQAVSRDVGERLGEMYELKIAPLVTEDELDSPWPAFFFPFERSTQTMVGPRIASVLKLHLRDDDYEVTFHLQDLGANSNYQIDINVPCGEIGIAQPGDFPDDWVQIGFQALNAQLNTDDFSQVSKKQLIVLRECSEKEYKKKVRNKKAYHPAQRPVCYPV